MINRSVMILLMMLMACAASAADEALVYKDRLSKLLVDRVPGILKTFNAETGRFGSGIFIVGDQNVLLPLAVAYNLNRPDNRFYKSRELLDVIMAGGDALIEAQDEKGMFRFDKKDGSYWNQIYMPWTYSRWIRAFSLIRDDMPAERRERWEKALTLGYEGISRTQFKTVHNIPAHHAMGTYIAGWVLGRPEWCELASAFMLRVAEHQQEGGYWSENAGPVVNYNFVYMDAIGTYLAVSGDERVRPALERAAHFHRFATYPDGAELETVDERNSYRKTAAHGNVGFTFTPAGRAWLAGQWQQIDWNLTPDNAASLILFGEEGPIEPAPASATQVRELVEGGELRALTLRQGPWFVALSGYTAPVPASRWIQDRQNLISLWHERVGLISGGGNTKLQPGWSTFSVGDVSRLSHTPGDESPNFTPPAGLFHVPSASRLTRQGDAVTMESTYGPVVCQARVEPADDQLRYSVSASGQTDLPVIARLIMPPRLGARLLTGGGAELTLSTETLQLSAARLGGRLEYELSEQGRVRIVLPAGATLHWPALPHNPYRRDGRSYPAEGRLELRIPLTPDGSQQSVTIEVLE